MNKKIYIYIGFFFLGAVFLILSYLAFINLIQIPGMEICGSACEYWWSWIINFPPTGICILVCVTRNALYKPFFVIGWLFPIIVVVFEVGYRIFKLRK